MPRADRVTLLPYSFTTSGTGANLQIAQHNELREYLLIQNRSLNAIKVTFGKPADAAPAPYIIAGMSEKEWKEKVPVESINLSSLTVSLAAFGTILEGRLLSER